MSAHKRFRGWRHKVSRGQMRVFIERFILGILPPIVVLLAFTNPLGFSWPLRILGILVIILLAGIAAFFAGWDEWRWQRLRGLWWLWAIFGLSGGVAFALWPIPLIVGYPNSGQLKEARQDKQELGNLTQQVTMLQSQLSSKQAELNNTKHPVTDWKQPDRSWSCNNSI